MTTKTTSKTPTKKFTYLRVPLDDNFNSGLQLILDDNPYFSPVDALRFAMGKYIKQTYFGKKKSNLADLINKISKKTFTRDISETEAQEILTQNGL
jgi:hypothetical protein